MKCEKCGKTYWTRECLNCKDKIFYTPQQNNHQTNKKKENIKTNNINKKHANFSIRLMAMAIDTVMVAVPISLLMNEYIADAVMAIIIIFLWMIWKGQSIGKKLVNIKIVNENYEDINLKTAIIRYIGYYISAIMFFVGYAIVPFRKDRMALHDLMAKTHVIHTDKDEAEIENDTADKVLAVLSMFIGFILIISLVVQYQQNKELEKMMKPIIKQSQDITTMSNQMTNQFKNQIEEANKRAREQMEKASKKAREQQLKYQQRTNCSRHSHPDTQPFFNRTLSRN